MDKTEETLSIYRKLVSEIKPYVKHNYYFDKLEPFLVFFDDIPTSKKESEMEYFIRIVWAYWDYKRMGVQKKSLTQLENTIVKYQKDIRDLYNSNVSDEVIYRNGTDYNYDGYADFDVDFDVEDYFPYAPKEIQINYLNNIALLKEIDLIKEWQMALKEYGGIKKVSPEYLYKNFKLLDPMNFYEKYRPSKDHLKKVLRTIRTIYNLKNSNDLKQLVDVI